jgi:hypothetical protein
MVAESLKKELELNNVTIHFKDVRRGFSSQLGYISIPLWAIQRNHFYALYYIVHELSHQIAQKKFNSFGHNDDFKEIEKNILAKFNLTIVYSKAYAKKLLKNNEVVYERLK